MRTSIIAVKAVIPTALEDTEINPFMVMSNMVVTRVLGNEGLEDELLKTIETWLTCHLIAVSKERQPWEERVGDIWLRYQENPKPFLESTTFGQTVLFLDPTGKFQATTMKKASFKAIKQEDC